MKVVHFAKFYPPEYGGIESVTEALAQDHSSAGHDVEVVCFTRNKTRCVSKERLAIRSVRALAEVASQPLAHGYVFACNDAAQDADIVHVHTPNLLAAISVLCLPVHIPVVVHWHADIQEKGALGILVRPIEQAMLRRADSIVATSEAYAVASKSLAPHTDRVSIIPIGIADVENTPKLVESARPYVLFVGRLVPYKGLRVLLDAFVSVNHEAEIRIVGIGPQEAQLKAQADRLGITDRVKFLGRVDDAKLQELMEGASIFCLPSIDRREAFGVVLLEAMRARRAIVATDIPGSGVRWVNEAGTNVPVGEPQLLADALNDLLGDTQKTLKLGMEGRRRFESQFTRRLMSSRFLETYAGLLSKNSKSLKEKKS